LIVVAAPGAVSAVSARGVASRAAVRGVASRAAVRGVASRPAVPGVTTFLATFEAERSVHWNQPRGVNLIDCHGQHYYGANGEDTTTIKTRRPFKVVVIRVGPSASWQFGDLPGRDPLAYGIEAHGVSTRSYTVHSGTTGGWCGAAQTDPQPATDCGTRLPDYQAVFSAGRRELTWSASFAQRTNEKFDFYNCPLTVPNGMYAGSFPSLPGRIDRTALFSPRKRTVIIAARKDYGPTATGVPNLGVDRTASGSVSWKLTLTRVR
jgi:hypothetical protein